MRWATRQRPSTIDSAAPISGSSTGSGSNALIVRP